MKTPGERQTRDILARLADGKRVRRTLPDRGRLNIDRPLPFLTVFRHPLDGYDPDTRRLVAGEASYLVASWTRSEREPVKRLVGALADAMTERFGAFLICELWAGPDDPRSAEGEPDAPPAFRIVAGPDAPPSTVTALRDALREVRIGGLDAEVEVVRKRPSPPRMGALVGKNHGCAVIGVEVRPIHRDPETKQPFPFVRRELHRAIARALRRAFFDFGRRHTTHRARSALALGKRAIVRAVYDVDHALAEVSYGFDFLLQVTPVNTEAAWRGFKRSRFERDPEFLYRPRPLDPALLKRRLYEVHVERVEDPTLAALLSEKRTELDRQLTLLADRETPNFLHGSIQLFGEPDPELEELAMRILERIPPRARDGRGGPAVRAPDVAKLATEELDFYRDVDPGFEARVEIRNDVTGLLVSRGNVLVSGGVRIPASRVDALLQHEVGVHAVTYHNGKQQPLRLLRSGLPGYEELQEGLAVLAEYLVGGLSRRRLRLLAARVVAVRSVCDGASFTETFRLLHHTHGVDQRSAFITTMRVHRGGGFTKDIVYLRGLHRVLEYLQEGGELDHLLVGKITLDSVDVVEELLARRVLQPPALTPRFLADPDAARHLEGVRAGLDILDLVEVKT